MTSGLIANNLTSSLMGVFAGIQTKIGVESNAKILVIGYPQIISNSSLGLGSPWSCITALSVGDLSASQSLAGDINSVIENAILSLDDERFHFVDPMVDSSFSEHDMCSDDWYIYPYDAGMPHEYVAHPTEVGQETYVSIIKEYLLSL